MEKVSAFGFLFFSLLGSSFSVGASGLDNVVYSPGIGVVCDRKVLLCADSLGLSVKLTNKYLGGKAAMDADKKLSNVTDRGVFTLSNGLHCDVYKKRCLVSKYSDKVDSLSTAVLFGRPVYSGRRIDVNSSSINSKLANYMCANASSVEGCVNSNLRELDAELVNKKTVSVDKALLMGKIKIMCQGMSDDPACNQALLESLEK